MKKRIISIILQSMVVILFLLVTLIFLFYFGYYTEKYPNTYFFSTYGVTKVLIDEQEYLKDENELAMIKLVFQSEYKKKRNVSLSDILKDYQTITVKMFRDEEIYETLYLCYPDSRVFIVYNDDLYEMEDYKSYTLRFLLEISKTYIY